MPKDTTGVPTLKELVLGLTPYGCIRIGVGFAGGGEIGISNNAPRIGLKFSHPLSTNEDDNFNIISQIEFGLNLVSRDETVEFAVDLGAGVAQVGDAVFARLGFVGLTYRDFEFTFGKQNSVYYTLAASEADQSLAFGGAALGVWNIFDGGISGTGRANQVMILKYRKGGLTLGAQASTRNISANSESVDIYGFAANYKIGGLGIGIGYNKVNDGVDDPLPNQASVGDEALIVAASYTQGRWLFSASYATLTNHQTFSLEDGDRFFYDATGIELFAKYKFTENQKWHAGVGFSFLNPNNDQEQTLGEFNTQFYILELAYAFKESSHIFASSQQDQSLNFDGDRRNQNIYGIGIRFGF